MSNIHNEPRITNPLVTAVRGQLEQRAAWLYLLLDEAKKEGVDPHTIGTAAIRRCGLQQGGELVKKGKTSSLIGLRKTLFTKPAQWMFEMKIQNCSDDQLEIHFHYCPLVKAWQTYGCSDEEISLLCEIAMCGDRGIGEAYGCELDLQKTIANGDAICHLRYFRPRHTDHTKI